jgi:hypothetical protein
MTNLVADRLHVNKLAQKIAWWVASAMLRRVELWDDNLVIPPALAARAAVLAFGDELLDLRLPDDADSEWVADSQWLSQGGRDMAAAHLLPRAEAALRQELQRLADALKRAREDQSSSSSCSRTLCRPGLRPTTNRFDNLSLFPYQHQPAAQKPTSHNSRAAAFARAAPQL